MLKTVIIADDLTGANDTGAIIAQNGFKVGTVLDLQNINQFDQFQVLCMSTDSRGLAPEEAYERVTKAATCFEDRETIFFSKRCDSTLRGNVGAEIDAILDTLDDSAIAVVVASFPNSGRTCIGNYLLVHHIPLEKTEVARDPIAPVKISRVTEIVKQQTKYSVGYIPLSTVLKGRDAVKADLLAAAAEHRIVVVDARTNEDIGEVAQGCIDSGLQFVAIDPGTFTASVAERYAGTSIFPDQKKILCGIGSATDLTRKQLKALREKYNPLIVKAEVSRFFDDGTRAEEIKRVAEAVIEESGSYELLVVATTLEDKDVVNFTDIARETGKSRNDCADDIKQAMAEIIYTIKTRLGDEIGGLYTSGGDIAASLCSRIEAIGFDVRDEVVPLAIYSKIIGGAFDGISIITKGGLVGDETTLVTCLDYLKEKIQAEG